MMDKLFDLLHVTKDKFEGAGRRKLHVIIICIVAVAVLGLGVKMVFFKGKAGKSAESELTQVRVQKVKKENYTDTYTVMGSIKGSVENELRFEIEGVIASYNFKEGDHVPQGRTICSLDPKDAFTRADYARSKYSSERSTFFSASQRMKVYDELFRMKAISESKLQEARFETQSAEARMKAALSELELAQSNLSKTNLVAPSDGMLAEIVIKPGDFVTPQDVVAKFIRGGDTNFEVDVPEKDVNRLKTGMKVKINCDSYPGKDFFGTLSEIAPTVKERTRTTAIKIGIANESGQLRSGMFGRGQIYVTEIENAMLVPSDSIVSLGDNASLVPIVKPDPKVPGEGTVEMRQIKPGMKLSQVTVIDDGLFPDEMVVVETQGQLTDGLRVKFSEIVTKKTDQSGSGSDNSGLGSSLGTASSN